MKKILIYGIGSLQNKGCEALVNSTINQIDSNIEIVAASFDYEHDKNMYKNRIKKIVDHHRQNEEEFTKKEKKLFDYYQTIPFDYNNFELLYQRDVVNEMQDADIAIHIGGDNYCYGVNEWIYSLNTKAKELNKKTVLWGASLYDEINDLELIEDLKKYDLLILREKISYNAIKKYIDEDKLILAPDPAFNLEPKEVKLNKWYNNRQVIGLNLSPLTIKTEENMIAVKKFIDYILEKTDYSIALIPHVLLDEASDLKILNELNKIYEENDRIYLENGSYNCQEIKYIISKLDFLVAARTHASIAAYSTLVPTLVIGYSVKSRGIAEDIFGNYQDYVLPNDELRNTKLIEKFNFILENKDEIKKILKERIKVIKEESATIFEKMNSRLDYLAKKNVCQKEKCTGCGACVSMCPVEAITLTKNSEGFYYPKIDVNKCINCGLCHKNCIVNKQEKSQQDRNKLICYAAKAKDDTIRKNSSSGGVFSLLATKVLQQKGIVYGATMEEFKVKHIRITTINDISKIRGSKYSQSNTSMIYKSVKQDLANKKTVLFSGTPCQILGLKNYLGKDYKQLITVSVICHGVINDNLLQKRILEFENKFETKVNKVTYRSKITGWDPSKIEYNSTLLNKRYSFTEDPLMSLYINDVILRESCYNCPAKGLDYNHADIVLGDYWGIYHINREMYDNLGVSAVILKTDKGKDLFEKVKNKLICLPTKYENIIKYNPAFYKSVNKPLERNKVFNDLESNTLEILSENYQLKKKLLDKTEINKLIEEKEKLSFELNQIQNSKRYQIADKVGNLINKIKK